MTADAERAVAAPPPLLLVECPPEDFAALAEPLREALEAAAGDYRERFPEAPSPVVTSARRTLRRQAALMAAMSDAELEGMYCRHGRPSYIDELEAARPLDEEKAYRILLNRREGYISKHLYGLAVDVAAATVAEPAAFKEMLARRGCAVLDESDMGRPCLHITRPDCKT